MQVISSHKGGKVFDCRITGRSVTPNSILSHGSSQPLLPDKAADLPPDGKRLKMDGAPTRYLSSATAQAEGSGTTGAGSRPGIGKPRIRVPQEKQSEYVPFIRQ